MPTCKKCHIALDNETIHCPSCGRVNIEARPETARSQAELAVALIWGDKGIKTNLELGRKWGEKAAIQGNTDGALCFFTTLLKEVKSAGVVDLSILDEDLLQRNQKYMRAAASGPAPEFLTLGYFYTAIHVTFLESDPQFMFQVLMKGAESGDSQCQTDIGRFYDDGDFIERDHDKAIEWFRKAADQGDPEAMYELGEDYTDEESPRFNLAKGLELLRGAIDEGYDPAKGALGLMYRFGVGVKKDLVHAINLMSDAATHNVVLQYMLGTVLWNGEDNVKPNLPVARKWMAKAAEKDYKDSKELLGKIDDAIALEQLGITEEELNAPEEPPTIVEEPAVPLSEVDTLRREIESLRMEVRRQTDRAEKFRSQLLAYTNRMEAERKKSLESPSLSKDSLFKAVRSRHGDPTVYVNLAKYFESAFGSDIAFTDRAMKSLEDCTSDINLVWTALYHLATTLHKCLKSMSQLEAYERFKAKAGFGLEIARGNGKMTHANNALMANYRDTYDGKEIDVESHVEKGGDAKSPRFLRVYFGYDPAVVDKIVVSHIGSHLPNFQTLTKVGGW